MWDLPCLLSLIDPHQRLYYEFLMRGFIEIQISMRPGTDRKIGKKLQQRRLYGQLDGVMIAILLSSLMSEIVMSKFK